MLQITRFILWELLCYILHVLSYKEASVLHITRFILWELLCYMLHVLSYKEASVLHITRFILWELLCYMLHALSYKEASVLHITRFILWGLLCYMLHVLSYKESSVLHITRFILWEHQNYDRDRMCLFFIRISQPQTFLLLTFFKEIQIKFLACIMQQRYRTNCFNEKNLSLKLLMNYLFVISIIYLFLTNLTQPGVLDGGI